MWELYGHVVSIRERLLCCKHHVTGSEPMSSLLATVHCTHMPRISEKIHTLQISRDELSAYNTPACTVFSLHAHCALIIGSCFQKSCDRLSTNHTHVCHGACAARAFCGFHKRFVYTCRHRVIGSQPMARLLATVCVLHVLTGAARAGVLGPGTDLWRQNSGSNNGGCSGCRLDKMGEIRHSVRL